MEATGARGCPGSQKVETKHVAGSIAKRLCRDYELQRLANNIIGQNKVSNKVSLMKQKFLGIEEAQTASPQASVEVTGRCTVRKSE